MDLDDFHLALKELRLVGAKLELEDAALPGFKRVMGVKVDGDHHLLIKLENGELTEVVKLHKKAPRRMDPDEFLEEVGRAAYDGEAQLT